MLALVAEGAVDRHRDYVHDGYMDVWGAYEEHLAKCSTLDEWLFIQGFDDQPHAYHIDGRIRYTVFDHTAFEIDTIASWIEEHFPNARSITEYGCGVGRNMLAMKRRFPHFDCYGYELAEAGVEVAQKAAAKLGMDVQYAPLDYVKDGPERYVHPKDRPRAHGLLAGAGPLCRPHRRTKHARPLEHGLDPSRAGRGELPRSTTAASWGGCTATRSTT